MEAVELVRAKKLIEAHTSIEVSKEALDILSVEVVPVEDVAGLLLEIRKNLEKHLGNDKNPSLKQHNQSMNCAMWEVEKVIRGFLYPGLELEMGEFKDLEQTQEGKDFDIYLIKDGE